MCVSCCNAARNRFFVAQKSRVFMSEQQFKKWNTIGGWLSFAIALLVYSLTVEPTMSFWDCGEYIATSAKLEVGHPPGAPLYQMMGAFFSTFAPDNQTVALMINMMSVFSSAFTVLFMFWTATILLRKLVALTDKTDSTVDGWAILAASFVGVMAFTFSDSFWYNAVEAEVYAMATLLIALLFWLGLRWEQDLDKARGNKWLLLIALVIGLSFGIHFMALLTIPSIGFLYFFKKYPAVTTKNFIIANIVVVSVLLFIFKLLLPWTMALFGNTEVFMVNSLGLPFNSGTIFVAVVLIGLFYFGLRYTKQKDLPKWNTLILSVLFILIGFSTWMMLPIRANANTVINENKPSDARELLAYYNREQYGINPLFYGPQFSDMYAGLDEEEPYKDKAPNYERDYTTGKYIITNNYKNAEQNSSSAHKSILPRMWSTEHAKNYMTFTHPLEFRINPEYSEEAELVQIISEFRQAYSQGQVDMEGYAEFLKAYSDYLIVERPSFGDNIGFMFEYQFGYMYWRYLMWNFTGRQNDIQGNYDTQDGNWISGINAVDSYRLGNQDSLTQDAKNNKGRNTYYFIPFILAILGMIYHANRDVKSFYVLLILFLFTGLALKIYLNERPFEPRERDYALVGSFYVFALWICYGVYGLIDYARKAVSSKIAVPAVFVATLLGAPVLMASQNWDDHDRSNKYTAVAMAKAYLSSCEPNAILFTIGDNDTFPLWYAQEVEGYRTDVRIVNTSLLHMDWYIDQMKAKAYESEPLPISFTHKQYVGDKLDYSVFTDRTDARWALQDFIKFLATDDERTLIELKNGQKLHFYPTNKVRFNIDKNAVIANKVVSEKDRDSIVDFIDFDIKGQALYKNRVMMLDIVANNQWKRPIYFTGGSFGDDDYLWMKDYLQLDGIVFKLVPVKTPVAKDASVLDMGKIDTDKMYKIVKNWEWGNSGSPDIYHDPETRKNSLTYRTNLSRLISALIEEGKNAQAAEVVDIAMKNMPFEYFGYYSLLDTYVEAYYKLGKRAEGRKLYEQLAAKYQDQLQYFQSLTASEQMDLYYEVVAAIERYRSVLQLVKKYDEPAYYEKSKTTFNSWNGKFGRFQRDNE